MITRSVGAVVIDIEGTTSATEAVHVGLYSYARPRLGPWLRAHGDDPEIATAMATVRADAGLAEDAAVGEIVAVLHGWMDADVKATPLKTIQGQIWAAGFAAGELRSHMFADVEPALRAWHELGLPIVVFSSGSIASQRPWFRHAQAGDLSAYLSGYHDTVTAGPKQEPSSYDAIAADAADRWAVKPAQLLFLSDVPGEVDAAAAAGWQTIGVRRPGEPNGEAAFDGHEVIASFAELELSLDEGDRLSYPEPSLVRAAGQRLADEATRLADLGWTRGTAGNLSEVVTREPLRLVVTASGIDKGSLRADDVAVVDDQGAAITIAGLPTFRPSAEAALHARIAATTGASAVVHGHPLAAVQAGARWPDGVVLRDLEMLKGIGRGAHDDEVVVPVVDNSQDMVELGDRVVAALVPGVPAVIVAGHGLYVWADTPTSARHHAEALDWCFSYVLGQTELTRLSRSEP